MRTAINHLVIVVGVMVLWCLFATFRFGKHDFLLSAGGAGAASGFLWFAASVKQISPLRVGETPEYRNDLQAVLNAYAAVSAGCSAVAGVLTGINAITRSAVIDAYLPYIRLLGLFKNWP